MTKSSFQSLTPKMIKEKGLPIAGNPFFLFD